MSAKAKTLTEPPNGGFGWVVVVAVFMIHFVGFGLPYTLGVYYPTLQEEFNSDSATTAWVAATHLAVAFGSGPVAGWLVDRYGTQRVSFVGGIVSAVGCVIAAFSDSIFVIILLMGVFAGFGTGLMFIAAVASVTRWFSTKRSVATGIAVCGAGCGVIAFAPLIRYLLVIYDRRGAMLIEAGLVLQGCVFGLLLRPIPASPSSKVKLHNLDNVVEMQPLRNGAAVKKPSPGSSGSSLLRNTMFWLFAISQFFTFVSASIVLSFLYSRVVKDVKIEPMEASLVVSVMGICNTVGRVGFGLTGNILPKTRTYLLSGAIVLYGGATALSVLGGSFWAAALHGGLFGAGYGGMFALSTVVLVDYFGIATFSSMYGMIGVFRGIACLVAPPIGGWIVSISEGSHSTVFVISGSLGLLGGVLVLLAPILHRKRVARQIQ